MGEWCSLVGIVGMVGCSTPSSATPPEGALPRWPALLEGISGVAVTDLALGGDPHGLLVAGTARRGVRLGDRTLSDTPGAFVLGMSPAAEALWARVVIGRAAAQIDEIVAGPGGEVYFAGFFDQLAQTGRLQLESAGDLDCMVGKLGPNGRVEWWVRFGGEGRDVCRGLALVDDRLWVVGGYSGDWLGSNAGESDVMILGLSTLDGSLIANQTFGTLGADFARDVAPTARGGIVVVGNFALGSDVGTVLQFDASAQLVNAGEGDAFALERFPDGATSWVTGFSTAGMDTLRSVAPVGDGWVLTGSAKTSGESPSETAFVSRLAADGAISWTWTATGMEVGHEAAQVEPEHILVVGQFRGEFGVGQERWATQPGDTGMIAVALDHTGTATTAYACDGPGVDEGHAVVATPDGLLYVGGSLGAAGPCSPRPTSATAGIVLPLRIGSGRLRPSV